MFVKKARPKATFGGGAVGTESMGLEQLERNQTLFQYQSDFVMILLMPLSSMPKTTI